jgi:photosystem II stability/assembly factor-like uncharacterized protein
MHPAFLFSQVSAIIKASRNQFQFNYSSTFNSYCEFACGLILIKAPNLSANWCGMLMFVVPPKAGTNMAKKYLITALSAISLIALSGCSLLPQTDNSSSGRNDAFSQKIEKGSLWKTENGGKNFLVKSQIDEKTRVSSADILSITYHPKKPATIYVGTVENGIFKTENGGENWEPIDFPPKRIYSFILDKNNPDNRMFASGVLGEWGKIFRTDDGGKNWGEVYTEPGQKTVVTVLSQHFRDNNVIFAGTSAGTIVKSTDGGDTWKNIGNKFDGGAADIVFDASKSFVTYLLMFGKKLYYSSDGGMKWIDWEEEKQKEVRALQEKASKVAVGGNATEAMRLQESAQKLSERNEKNKMPDGMVSITSDPLRSGIIYAGTGAGLFQSTDYGKYWYEVNIIESAKKFPIRSIAINPGNSNEIVFVAGKAFYKSVNGGETWAVTGLNVDRDASFVSYDPFDSKYLFVGLRKFQ